MGMGGNGNQKPIPEHLYSEPAASFFMNEARAPSRPRLNHLSFVSSSVTEPTVLRRISLFIDAPESKRSSVQ